MSDSYQLKIPITESQRKQLNIIVLLDDELVKFFATSERMDGLNRSFGGLTSSVSENK